MPILQQYEVNNLGLFCYTLFFKGLGIKISLEWVAAIEL
jgi:hypothetical protein